MDTLEKIGYSCLGFLVLAYFVAMIVGIFAVGVFGWLGLIALVGVGTLLIKVLKERLGNKEDDHYSRTIEK